jgi:4-hydroxy-tetrahydrodipicolinate synthase
MSKIHELFYGTAAAVVTPFKHDGSIDYDTLTRMIERLIQAGLDYLVVLGSTGEAATLSSSEKEQVRRHFVEVTNGRVPLVIGIGDNDTANLIHKVKNTDLSGYKAILSASPSYNKPSQEGLYHHYAALAEVSPLPVILYNVPGRTAKNMEPDTVLRLAHDFDNIIGIKEAAGNMEQILRLLKDKPREFLVISGDDMLALPTVCAGGAGVISVIAQAFPGSFSQLIREGLEGHVTKAYEKHFSLMKMIDLIFEEGNPTGIKQLLNLLGFGEAFVRLPLTQASNELKERIRQELHKIS